MGKGMVSDNVPFLDHAFDKLRIVFNEISHYEKGSRNVVLFQSVQDCRHISVFIAAVKGKVKNLFFRIFCKISVVPG